MTKSLVVVALYMLLPLLFVIIFTKVYDLKKGMSIWVAVIFSVFGLVNWSLMLYLKYISESTLLSYPIVDYFSDIGYEEYDLKVLYYTDFIFLLSPVLFAFVLFVLAAINEKQKLLYSILGFFLNFAAIYLIWRSNQDTHKF